MSNLRRLYSYQWVSLEKRDLLPPEPGIYYAIKDGMLLYVGQSKNLHRRWNDSGDRQHQHLACFLRLGGVDLHYRKCPVWQLNYQEARDIQRFKPKLNVLRPNPRKPLLMQLDDAAFYVACVIAAGLFLWTIAAWIGIKPQNPPYNRDYVVSLLTRYEQR